MGLNDQDHCWQEVWLLLLPYLSINILLRVSIGRSVLVFSCRSDRSRIPQIKISSALKTWKTLVFGSLPPKNFLWPSLQCLFYAKNTTEYYSSTQLKPTLEAFVFIVFIICSLVISFVLRRHNASTEKSLSAFFVLIMPFVWHSIDLVLRKQLIFIVTWL